MRYFHLEIENVVALRADTIRHAERILTNVLGIKPTVLRLRAANMTRYHRRRSLILGVTDDIAGVMEAHFTGGGATPLPQHVTLLHAGMELMIDTKSWGTEYNDGRNRGFLQPRLIEEDENPTNLEGD